MKQKFCDLIGGHVVEGCYIPVWQLPQHKMAVGPEITSPRSSHKSDRYRCLSILIMSRLDGKRGREGLLTTTRSGRSCSHSVKENYWPGGRNYCIM